MLNVFAVVMATLPLPAAIPAGVAAARVPVADAYVEQYATSPASALSTPDLLPAAEAIAPPKRASVTIPGGAFVPFYGDRNAVEMEPFELDAHPVSRAEFRDFVLANPRWRRDAVSGAFAAESYLRDWLTPTQPGDDAGTSAVVDVSWFAAKAYCAWTGGRLPTLDEWEYAALADETRRDATHDVAYRQRILDLTTRATRAALGSGFRNVYGVHDMHGVVREWVRDFNAVMVSDDSRGTGVDDGALYCAAGASNARDANDYAAFLRYAYRASLTGRSTQKNLGFRCARSAS